MAYVNATRIADWGIAHLIGSLMTKLNDQRRRNRVYRQTVRELNALNDRDLADLGIARSTIRSIAMQAAYGK